MNILLYSSQPTVRYGGVARWAQQVLGSLRDLGHDVHVLTWGRGERAGLGSSPGERWGSKLHYQPLNRRISNLPVVGFWYTLLSAARAGRRLIEEHQIQVLHTLSVYETYGAHLARGSSEAAIVLSIHGDYVTEQDEWWKSRWRRRLYRPLERNAFRNCQAVTTSSAWLRDRLAAQFGRTRAVVIPNGVTLAAEATAQGRPALGLPEDARIILTMNSLYAVYRQRGLKLLVAAAPAVVEQVPAALFLVVGGVNDPVRDRRLVDWAREQATGLPFMFTGYRQRPPTDLLAEADLYAHPSYLDNSPTAVMEAMLLGKPIVATQVGGIPELITDGETGLLVPTEPGALAGAIVHLLQDPAYAQRLGANARQRASRDFSWARVGEQFTALYQQAVRDRKASHG